MDERRDDWRQGVDENLASLNAGQRIFDREVDNLHKILAEIDKDLRGSLEDERDGLIARFRAIETTVNMLKGVIDVDRAGNKGLLGRVEALEGLDRKAERRLRVWIALIGLISALLVGALSNFDRLEAIFARKAKTHEKRPKTSRKTDPIRPITEEIEHS